MSKELKSVLKAEGFGLNLKMEGESFLRKQDREG